MSADSSDNFFKFRNFQNQKMPSLNCRKGIYETDKDQNNDDEEEELDLNQLSDQNNDNYPEEDD